MSKNRVNSGKANVRLIILSMLIPIQAWTFQEGVETISQESRPAQAEVHDSLMLGDDIVRSSSKGELQKLATNDNLLSTYFERRLIQNLKEKVWFYQLATKFPLPKMEGTTITFNGWNKLGAASATLGEGSANDAVNLSSRKVTSTIASYGRAVDNLAALVGNC